MFLYLRQISNIQSQEAKKSTVALMRELANKLAKQLVEEQKLYLKRPRKFLSECRFCKKRTKYTSSVKYEKRWCAIYKGMLLRQREDSTNFSFISSDHFQRLFTIVCLTLFQKQHPCVADLLICQNCKFPKYSELLD